MKFKVDSKAARLALENTVQEIESNAQRAIENVVAAVGRNAKSTRAFRDQSGDLRRSITTSTGVLKGFVKAGAPYADYVEYGNGRSSADGYIYPKNSKFLRFQINGQTVFRRRVKVAAPRPFMEPALRQGEILLRNALVGIVDTAARKHNE